MKFLKGVCHFFWETGTEGGHWAFQDAEFISAPSPDYPVGQWSYEGLHVLEDGDKLTIYDKENHERVVWEGVVSLEQYGLFTEDAFGLWIHADQNDMDRETWADWFMKEYPAELVLGPKHKEAEHG